MAVGRPRFTLDFFSSLSLSLSLALCLSFSFYSNPSVVFWTHRRQPEGLFSGSHRAPHRSAVNFGPTLRRECVRTSTFAVSISDITVASLLYLYRRLVDTIYVRSRKTPKRRTNTLTFPILNAYVRYHRVSRGCACVCVCVYYLFYILIFVMIIYIYFVPCLRAHKTRGRRIVTSITGVRVRHYKWKDNRKNYQSNIFPSGPYSITPLDHAESVITTEISILITAWSK